VECRDGVALVAGVMAAGAEGDEIPVGVIPGFDGFAGDGVDMVLSVVDGRLVGAPAVAAAVAVAGEYALAAGLPEVVGEEFPVEGGLRGAGWRRYRRGVRHGCFSLERQRECPVLQTICKGSVLGESCDMGGWAFGGWLHVLRLRMVSLRCKCVLFVVRHRVLVALQEPGSRHPSSCPRITARAYCSSFVIGSSWHRKSDPRGTVPGATPASLMLTFHHPP